MFLADVKYHINPKTKKMKYLFIFSFAIITFFCCTKTDFRKTGNKISTSVLDLSTIISGDSADFNLVTLYSNQRIYRRDSSFTTRLLASFKDTVTHKTRGVSALYLNGQRMTASADSTYCNTLNDSSGSIYPSTNISIYVKGISAADTLTKSIYVPKKMISLISDYPFDTVDLSHNFTLKWNADSHTTWNNVVIALSYLGPESQNIDSTLPASITPLFYIAPDNGSYTIDSAALSSFPHKAWIQIVIGRGTQVAGTLPISKRRIQFFGISSASTIALKVK